MNSGITPSLGPVWLQAYSHSNLGDDLFIALVSARYPHIQFQMASEETNELLRALPNVKVHPYNKLKKLQTRLTQNPLAFEKQIRASDGTVLVGGSMFMESPNWQKSFDFYKRLVESSTWFSCMSSNFGPYTSPAFKEAYGSLFEKMDDLCFRDQRSLNMFINADTEIEYADDENEDKSIEAAGNRTGGLRQAPDLAFTLKFPDVPKKEKHLVISLVNLYEKEKLKPFAKLYEEQVVSLCKEFLADGWSITLMSFCALHKDDELCTKIAQQLDSSKVSTFFYTGNLKEALEVIGSASLIIATRFHAMVLGWLAKTKVYPLIYDEKMTNLIADLYPDAQYAMIDEGFNLSKDQIEEKAGYPLDIDEISSQAISQFTWLDGKLGAKNPEERVALFGEYTIS